MSRSLSLKRESRRTSPLTAAAALGFAVLVWKKFVPGARRYLRIHRM